MGALTLARLLGARRLDELLAAARAVEPRLAIRIVAGDGAGHGDGAPPSPGDDATTTRRPIVVDSRVLGAVEAGGRGLDPALIRAHAELVGRSIELAAAEGLARREVTGAALDDLRELALLSRLAQAIVAAGDPSAIAGCVLETISRPLGPVAGIVLADDGITELASAGTPEAIEALRVAGAPVLEQLRAEDPIEGSCAEIGPDPGSAGRGLIGVVLAAFLRTAGGYRGSILLGRSPDQPLFTAGDKRLVASVASQAALALERADLQRAVADRRALDQELAIGRRIQVSLMPRRFPEIPGWEIAATYEAAREVGGDFYDVFGLRDQPGRLGLVVADVTGKGIPAAILMADSRALIHAAADHGGTPVETLSRVNQILISERSSGLFVTVAHAVLDTATGRLELASAGHDAIHVLRADGRLDILDPPGRLVGMVADLQTTLLELVLEPGDTLVAHTDGVTEARSPGGGFYGEDRFRALLRSLAGADAGTIVATVDADVAAFRSGADPSDDLTLLVVRHRPDEVDRAWAGRNVDPRAGGSSDG
jgi:serine phosphatase RsbU (regulator of sigma subunit)